MVLVFCCHAHLDPQIRISMKSAQHGHDIAIRDFNKKCFVQKLQYLCLPLRVHIHNINRHMYISSARGHELSSGRVHAHSITHT